MSWDYTGDLRIKFAVEGRDNVSVPAGQFEAIKVVARKATPLQDEVTWWARGVGIVKREYSGQSGNRIVEELAEYSTPGVVQTTSDLGGYSPGPGRNVDRKRYSRLYLHVDHQ